MEIREQVELWRINTSLWRNLKMPLKFDHRRWLYFIFGYGPHVQYTRGNNFQARNIHGTTQISQYRYLQTVVHSVVLVRPAMVIRRSFICVPQIRSQPDSSKGIPVDPGGMNHEWMVEHNISGLIL
jgi:hypothetical protein